MILGPSHFCIRFSQCSHCKFAAWPQAARCASFHKHRQNALPYKGASSLPFHHCNPDRSSWWWSSERRSSRAPTSLPPSPTENRFNRCSLASVALWCWRRGNRYRRRLHFLGAHNRFSGSVPRAKRRPWRDALRGRLRAGPRGPGRLQR
jgi:hypothetical protein